MAENASKAHRQDEASTSKTFLKMPIREPEEHTVITITTDSETTDGEKPTYIEDKTPEMDKVTEVHAPPPTITASQTLSAQTPMPTSPNGCSTGHSARTNSRDHTATPTKPSDDTVETAEGEIHVNEKSRIGFRFGRVENKNTVRFEEKIIYEDPVE